MKEISLHILDIMRNSLEANAGSVWLEVAEHPDKDFFYLKIRDNAKGMSMEKLNMIGDPSISTRRNRKYGMGIALLKQHAEMTGGAVNFSAPASGGLQVEAWFNYNHPDCQPMGDLPGVVRMFLAEDHINFYFKYQNQKGNFSISTEEIKRDLELDNLQDNKLLLQIESLVSNALKNINARLN